MMQLAIEGLKPMYATLAKAIKRNVPGSDEYEECFGALNELCRMILSTQTTYEGMSMPQFMMHVENDMRFVAGHMNDVEEEQHIKYHWDLIEQRDKELQEFMKQQKQ